MNAVRIILATAAFSFGQTVEKSAAPPIAKKATAPAAKLDTWQRSKECAAQAEKLVATWFKPPDEWKNHYSPKYDRCFAELSFASLSSDKGFPSLFQKLLIDAFERSTLARTCTALGHPDCVEEVLKSWRPTTLNTASIRLTGKPFAEATGAEQGAARRLADKMEREAPSDTSTYCGVDGKATDCKEAAGFISEHMKN
jgi:hypothetical protein